MKHTFYKILAAIAAGFLFNTAQAVSPVYSDKSPTYPLDNPATNKMLGEWWTGPGNLAAVAMARAYAEQHNIPLMYVWGQSTCGVCKTFDNHALSDNKFIRWRQEKKMVMLYIKNDMPSRIWARDGVSYPGGPTVSLKDYPFVFVYWKKSDGSTVELRFTGSTNKMLASGPTFVDQLINSLDKYLDYTPVPPVGKINLSGSVASGSILTEGFAPVTYTLSRTGGTTGAVTAHVDATGSTAGLLMNGAAQTSLSFTWAAGDAVSKTFTVAMPATPAVYEPPRTVTFTVRNPTSPPEAYGTTVQHSITIHDQLTPKVGAATLPANNATFSYEDIKTWPANEKELKLEWPKVDWAPGSSGNKLYLYWSNAINNGFMELDANATNANAFAVTDGAATMVPTNAVAGAVRWYLKAEFDGGTYGTVSIDSPERVFTINQLPVFVPLPRIYGYKGMKLEFTVQVDPPAAIMEDCTKSLPPGLSVLKPIQNNKLVISGMPSKIGVTTVWVTARNALNSNLAAQYPVTIEIAALPKSVAGKFNLMFENNKNELSGTGSMTVGTTGRISAKANMLSAYSFSSGIWQSRQDGTFYTEINRSGDTLRLTLDAAGKEITDGVLTLKNGGTHTVTGARQDSASSFAGYYTVVLEGGCDSVVQGCGYLTLNFINANSVRYSGKLADGTSVSGSTFAIQNGGKARVPVFKALYSKRGVVAGVLEVNGGGARLIGGEVNWRNPGKASNAFADAFNLAVDAEGSFYNKTLALNDYVTGGYAFCAAEPDIAGFSLADPLLQNEGRIPLVMSGTSLGVQKNPASKTTFRGNRSNGLISGRIPMLNTANRQVTVPYNGVLVRNHEDFGGAGYYLITDKARVKHSYAVWVKSDDCGCNEE